VCPVPEISLAQAYEPMIIRPDLNRFSSLICRELVARTAHVGSIQGDTGIPLEEICQNGSEPQNPHCGYGRCNWANPMMVGEKQGRRGWLAGKMDSEPGAEDLPREFREIGFDGFRARAG